MYGKIRLDASGGLDCFSQNIVKDLIGSFQCEFLAHEGHSNGCHAVYSADSVLDLGSAVCAIYFDFVSFLH